MGKRLLRIIIAVTVLLTFWGAVAYSYRLELAPRLSSLIQSFRSLGGDRFESRHFEVTNNSTASRAQIRHALDRLEADYSLIRNYLNLETRGPFPVLVSDGSGPTLYDGQRLVLFHDRGAINLDTAPLYLIFLARGQRIESGNWFLQGGFAIYVSEEIGRASALGQPADDWVTLLNRKNARLPFEQAWEIDLPENEVDMFDFARAVVQGGSFVRWLAEAYNPEVVDALLDGQRLEDVTGLYFDQAEQAWLDALAAKEQEPLSCGQAILNRPYLQPLCERLDGTD